MNSDRLTKQIVIGTLCLITGALVATMCSLALRQLPVPVEVKDLATYVVGVLSGMLIKTGVEGALREDEPISVKADKPLPVEVADATSETARETPVEEDAPKREGGARVDPLSRGRNR